MKLASWQFSICSVCCDLFTYIGKKSLIMSSYSLFVLISGTTHVQMENNAVVSLYFALLFDSMIYR